jgi:hypothetical protein
MRRRETPKWCFYHLAERDEERNLQKKFGLKTRFTFLKTGESESFNSAFTLNNAIIM